MVFPFKDTGPDMYMDCNVWYLTFCGAGCILLLDNHYHLAVLKHE